jgi:arsenate reductase (glutaredoxin)
MRMEILGLKTCDTCRKAIKALPDARFRDVRADPLTTEEWQALLQGAGSALLNRASTTWRALTEEERGKDALTLLAAHPALMKRPVIRANGAVHLGWNDKVRSALGLV